MRPHPVRIVGQEPGQIPDEGRYAAFSLMPAEAAVLTVEFKTNLLAPAKGERFLFRGHVVKPGKTLTVCEAQAFASLDNAEERMIATMTGTLMALFDRQDIVQ
jgi:acyl-coenzyme A thioesterase PaaI-like protein